MPPEKQPDDQPRRLVDHGTTRAQVHQSMQQREFMFQLLEQYANDHGHCEYAHYQPKPIPGHALARSKLQQAQQRQDGPRSNGTMTANTTTTTTTTMMMMPPRICFSIVAHTDFVHLQRLVQAIHQPYHYIIIHLEQYKVKEDDDDDDDTNDFATLVRQQLEDKYDNLVVLQFGSIVYLTDSITLVQRRIMAWLLHTVQLQFDYLVTLDGCWWLSWW